MATLRNLIDGKSLDCNATEDVFDHLKKAKKAKLKNDMANIKLQTKLAPTRQLIQLVDQEHPMPGQAPGQQQQFDQNGNPVNLQNPQLDNQGNPMPNQQPPMKPGIGQPNVARGNQNMPQKKPGFPSANKTSTKDKLANDKNKKQVGGKKGIEVHVKAKGEEIDQLNVKKKKKLKANDYHDDAGMSQMPSRGVGLSGGGPGSGRHAIENTLQKHGYKNDGSGQFVHKSGSSVIVTKHGDWSHYRSNEAMTKSGSGARNLNSHLTTFHSKQK